MRRTLTAVLAVAALLPGAAPANDELAMQQAMELFERGQYAQAAEHLRAAADAGDARAAEILGFMYGFGASMFPGMSRDLREADRWFDRAARGGQPVGRYMVCALRRQTGAAPHAPRRCFDWVAVTGQPAPR